MKFRRCRLPDTLVCLALVFIFVAVTADAQGESPSLVAQASPEWAQELVEGGGLPAFFSEDWLIEQWRKSKVEGWEDRSGYEERRETRRLIDLLAARTARPDRLKDNGCFKDAPWDHLAERNWPPDWETTWGRFKIADLVKIADQTLHARIVALEEGNYLGAFGTLYKVEPIEWFGVDQVPVDAFSPRYFFLRVYEINLNGVSLCKSRDGFWSFDAGDEVLLLGSLIDKPEQFYSTGHVFPVKDGLVTSQPYPGLLPEHLPVPIVSLR